MPGPRRPWPTPRPGPSPCPGPRLRNRIRNRLGARTRAPEIHVAQRQPAAGAEDPAHLAQDLGCVPGGGQDALAEDDVERAVGKGKTLRSGDHPLDGAVPGSRLLDEGS